MINLVDPYDFVSHLTPKQTEEVLEACWQHMTDEQKEEFYQKHQTEIGDYFL